MASRISGIVPFLLITLVCVGGVEAFYFVLERALLAPKVLEQEVAALQAPPAGEKAVAAVEQTAAVDHAVIMQRNLFGPPPKKAEQAAPVQEALEATTLDLVLMGTIHGLGDENRAIILTKKDRKQDIYRVGDQIQGALIKEIRRANIVLTVDGRDESLDMSESGKYAPAIDSGPVAANMPLRSPSMVPLPNEQPGEVMPPDQQVKPRVVRPTRKIVSSRRRLVQPVDPESPEEMMSPDEEGPPEDVEELEAEQAEDGPPEQETVE